MNDKILGDLLESACKELNKQEEKEVEELFMESAETVEAPSKQLLNKLMKKCLPLLYRQHIKNVTLNIWENEGSFFKSFGDLLKTSIARCGMSRAQIFTVISQNESDIEKFENLKTPIVATKDISELVSILDAFGISVQMLAEIVKNENWRIAASYATASADEVHAVIDPFLKDEGKMFQPNQTEFFMKIREEIANRELDELL